MTFEQCATCVFAEVYWVCDRYADPEEHYCSNGWHPTWECEAGEETVCAIILKMDCPTWEPKK